MVGALRDGNASQRQLAVRLGYKTVSKALRETVAALVEEGVVFYSGNPGAPNTKLALSTNEAAKKGGAARR